MNNNIYEMLNDAEINTENYRQEQLNDMEKRRIKNTVLKKSSSRNRLFKTGVAAAAVIAITATSGVVFKNEVYAFVKQMQYKLNLFVAAEDIESYVKTVNTTVEDGHIAVTLNEVIMDNDELIVTSTVTFTEGESHWIHASEELMIDGKLIQGGSSGAAMQTDGNTFENYTVYNIEGFDIDPGTTHNISYNISGFTSLFNDQQTEYKGKWNFAFTAEGSELFADTKTVPLTDTITFPEGSAYQLIEYSTNALGQKISFDIDGDNSYFTELRGWDNLGNDVVFYVSHTREGKGIFKVETIDNGYVSPEAKTLTLTPYIMEMPKESGKMGNNYMPLDQEIVIHIQ